MVRTTKRADCSSADQGGGERRVVSSCGARPGDRHVPRISRFASKWKLERARPHDLSCAGCDNASLICKREETSWAKICHSGANL